MSKENKKRPGMLGGSPVFSAGESSLAKRLTFGESSLIPEYSMLDAALQLGGKIILVNEGRGYACPPGREEAGQPQAAHPGRPVEPQGATGAGGALDVWRDNFSQWEKIARPVLSTTHIRPDEGERKNPFFEYYENASIFKVCKGGVSEKIGGGLRGKIGQFSYASRRRLQLKIGQIRRDAALPAFVTLTYPDVFPKDHETFKQHLAIFSKRFRRAFPKGGFVWKLEPQTRGAAHYHLLVWGCEMSKLVEFVPKAWFEIAGGGDPFHLAWHSGLLGNGNSHCVQAVRSFEGVASYASKYLGKTFEVAGWDNVGRFWGIVARQNIPFGEKKIVEVSYSLAVVAMRYQRRFSQGKKSRKKRHKTNGKSKTIFCDAGQWVNRLL